MTHRLAWTSSPIAPGPSQVPSISTRCARGPPCVDASMVSVSVMGGSGEMVRFLIESGADLSLPDYKGRDARTLATEMGRNDLASLIPTRA